MSKHRIKINKSEKILIGKGAVVGSETFFNAIIFHWIKIEHCFYYRSIDLLNYGDTWKLLNRAEWLFKNKIRIILIIFILYYII